MRLPIPVGRSCSLLLALVLLGLAAAPTMAVVLVRGRQLPARRVNPIVNSADGRVSFPAEWDSSAVTPEVLGGVYGESRWNWLATSSTDSQIVYPWFTGFLLHDMTAARTQDMADWNAFQFGSTAGTVDLWVFANADTANDTTWVRVAGLDTTSAVVRRESSGTNLIDDRGFLVRLNGDPNSDRHWLPGMAEPGDPSFKWSDWYDVFGTSGFNNSSFTQGLQDSVAAAHEVYEVAFRAVGGGPPPRRCYWAYWFQVKDPRSGVPVAPKLIVVVNDPRHYPTPDSIVPNPLNHAPGIINCPRPNCQKVGSDWVWNLGALQPNTTHEYVITSYDQDGTTPQLSSSAGILAGTSFVDHADGTGTLTITPTPSQLEDSLRIGVVAMDDELDSDILLLQYYVSTSADVPPGEPAGMKVGLLALPSVTSGSTQFAFDPPPASTGTLMLLDIAGRVIRKWSVAPGTRRIAWDGCDSGGRNVAAGLYNVRLTGELQHGATRVVIVR